MGSGNRIKFYKYDSHYGIGLFVGRFPFALTIGVGLLLWHFEVGFGKAYDA